MALTDQRFARSEATVRQIGYTALIQSLGYADAIRFLTQPDPGQGNYINWQNQALDDLGVDELYERAEAHWEKPGG